jgi:hypothetical protein
MIVGIDSLGTVKPRTPDDRASLFGDACSIVVGASAVSGSVASADGVVSP